MAFRLFGSFRVLVADWDLHSWGGRRSSVSEPPESHWLAARGSLTLDHQPPAAHPKSNVSLTFDCYGKPVAARYQLFRLFGS